MFYVKQTWKGIENLQYIDENQVNNRSNNLLFVTGTRLNPTWSGKVRCNHNETNSQMVLTLGVLRQRPQSQEQSFAKLDTDAISWTLVPNIYRSRLNIYPLLIVSVWSVFITSNNVLNIFFCRFNLNVRLKSFKCFLKEGTVWGRDFLFWLTSLCTNQPLNSKVWRQLKNFVFVPDCLLTHQAFHASFSSMS